MLVRFVTHFASGERSDELLAFGAVKADIEDAWAEFTQPWPQMKPLRRALRSLLELANRYSEIDDVVMVVLYAYQDAYYHYKQNDELYDMVIEALTDYKRADFLRLWTKNC